MRRKSILGIALGMCMAVATPVMAEAPDIDLASMSTEDLITLRDSIHSEIANRDGDNIITKGLYVVGTDIKAANFKVFYYGDASDENDCVNFYIYDNKDNYDNYEMDGQVLLYSDDKNGGILNLKDGQYVSVSTGSAIIEEVNPSWKPE